MPRYVQSYLKFLVKTRVVLPLRSLCLFVSAVSINREGWEKRLLIVNLQALGDLVLFTSVLKHYKRRFPDTKVYLLIKKGTGIDPFLAPTFADEVITLDYKKFAVSPFYGAGVINRLRRIGFQKVINHDFSAAEIQGKIISTNLGAEGVVGYEGLGVELRHPFDLQQKKNIRIVRSRINPRYTKLIPAIDGGSSDPERLPCVILHYIAIYEGATGFHESEYALTLPSPKENGAVLARFGLVRGKYAILNVNASVAYKRWPFERFKMIAEFVAGKGYPIVLVGVQSERELTEKFRKMCGGIQMINTSGELNLSGLFLLVSGAFLSVTNDTSLVHIAVALKKPSLTVLAGGTFGMFADYGYHDINKWTYERTPCYCDNWQCARSLPPGTPAPCLISVSAEKVMRVLDGLLGHLEECDRNHLAYPRELFSPGQA